VILVFLAAAATSPDCYKLKNAIAKDECLLKQAMLAPAPNCAKQMTQFDMNVCSFQVFLKSDIEMNRAWSKALSSARASDKWSREHKFGAAVEVSRLVAAQRSWIAFRDAQCRVEAGTPDEGGSMWAMNDNWCRQKLTDVRTAELREYAEPKN